MLTLREKKSIARSYWIHCYREWSGIEGRTRPVMRPEDMAFYLVGYSISATREQVLEAVRKLKSIRLLSELETFNLNPDLVREILNDLVVAADKRATDEFQKHAATWGPR